MVTVAQLQRALAAERDYLLAKFDVMAQHFAAIDEATKVLHETVTRTPTEIQREVTHLRELDEQKFASVTLQFQERDKRSERESRDNKTAVDAAFSAQKEAATKQDEANTKAIDKSERATTDAIAKNAQSALAAIGALSEKLDDLKGQFIRLESRGLGGVEARQERREVTTSTIGIAAFVITVLVSSIGLIGFIIGAR